MPGSRYNVHEVEGYAPRIGKAVWRMFDCRRRTLAALDGLADEQIDVLPEGFENTIGSLLYHLAVIEADWLYQDILGVDYPDWLTDVFPFDDRDAAGNLSPARGLSLDQHLERLKTVRNRFLEEFTHLEPGYLDLPRQVEDHEVTPGWVLHHLRQHEAEHRGQIQAIRTALSLPPPSP
jgi:uncharacterized damage-inducible protein DinB